MVQSALKRPHKPTEDVVKAVELLISTCPTDCYFDISTDGIDVMWGQLKVSLNGKIEKLPECLDAINKLEELGIEPV